MTKNRRPGPQGYYLQVLAISEMEKTIILDSYKIILGSVQSAIREYMNGQSYSRIAVLVDEHTEVHCLPKIIDFLPEHTVIRIKSGEIHKSLDTCSFIWSEMANAKMDRHSLFINLGGGVIGDMGGFAASCFMRGIDFIQVPTTLLSQVDASVGGKLAIDFSGYKNFIGLFQDPCAVLIDPAFLKTLPSRELRSGFAEMIKHGLIRDEVIWQRLVEMGTDWEQMNWQEEIYESVQVKKEVVTEDPQEKGLRKILNFGHTIGHAIESVALESSHPLLHGEAIGLGMIAETILSTSHAGLNQQAADQIIDYIRGIYHDLDISALRETEGLIPIMQSDKKNRGGVVLFSLLEGIGNSVYNVGVTVEDFVGSLNAAYDILASK